MSATADNSNALLKQLINISRHDLIAISYQTLDVSTAGVKSLTVPPDARYAEIAVESSNTTSVAMRYLILGDKVANLPTAVLGLPLRDATFFDVTVYANLVNFRVIQTAAATNLLTIQYYK